MSNFIISLPLNELATLIAKELSTQQAQQEPKTPITESKKVDDATLYTRVETAKILKITLPTLHSFVNKGKITPIRLGKTVRFRHDDLMKLIQQPKKPKYYQQTETN